MKKKIKIKIFGWYVYISRQRLKNYHPQLSVCNRNILAKFIEKVRKSHYKATGGSCERCGERHKKSSFQMHHILPLNEFPLLAREEWNLMMLCPRCHYMIHHNPVWNLNLMEQVAKQHGINLEHELHQATAMRWHEKQQARTTN